MGDFDRLFTPKRHKRNPTFSDRHTFHPKKTEKKEFNLSKGIKKQANVYSRFAELSYSSADEMSSAMKDLNIGKDWKYKASKDGISIFENDNTVVISSRGTQGGKIVEGAKTISKGAGGFISDPVGWVRKVNDFISGAKDIKTDVELGLGQLRDTNRYKDLKEVAESYKSEGKTVILTGHSLGGALAHEVGKDLELESHAFNRGSNWTESEGDANPYNFSYVVEGDVVSTLHHDESFKFENVTDSAHSLENFYIE